jgi:hypothetical protein
MIQLHRPSYETSTNVSMSTVTFYNFDPKKNQIHNENLEPVRDLWKCLKGYKVLISTPERNLTCDIT